jgi:voltage-gated potassium channel Kch|tara:strand:- start:512 stop:1354 length:843 start_codon:yes stop_codon:yes gene_type:complete
MSREIENAIEETINTGYDFKLGTYLSDGWGNCKSAILPNWGFMTLALIISIIVGITPFIGIFVLIGYIFPALTAGIFYYIHYASTGENTFGNFFKGFLNANIIGYFWLIILVSIVISTPSIIYSYSLGLYDPIIKMYELVDSGTLEQNKLFSLAQELERLQGNQGILYKIVYYSTLIASTTFSISQFIGFPILVSSNLIGPIKALGYSFKLCINKIWWLLLLYVALLAINYVGAILLTLGLIITIPFSAGIIYSIYKTEVLSKLDKNQATLSGNNDLLDV